MKKFSAILLALILVLAMTATAFAESTTTGTITINKAKANQTYTIYEIFKVDSYNKDNNAYQYSVKAGWESFVTKMVTDGYLKAENGTYVFLKNAASDVAAFAKAAMEYAKTNNIGETDSKVADSETVVFNELELGYYLVGSSVGALCSLDTTNPDATIEEKNTEIPDSDKVIVEGNEEKSENTAQIGDVINFKATIKAYAGAENYVWHDKMTEGLTYNGDVTVAGLTKDTDYTVVTDNLEDGCTFHVVFTKSYLDSITGTKDNPTVITITYSATVNEKAVKNTGDSTNTAYLEYGDDNKTTEDETHTFVATVTIDKYDGRDESKNKKLAGAEFVLYKMDGANKVYYKYDTNAKKVTWVSDVALADKKTTGTDGAATFEGLAAGTYYLEETKAPDGYNKLAAPVKVKVEKNNNTTHVTTEVENFTGSELPSTGGMGTTIFYVVGGLMMAAAVVILVAKKKVAAEK